MQQWEDQIFSLELGFWLTKPQRVFKQDELQQQGDAGWELVVALNTEPREISVFSCLKPSKCF